MEDGNWGSAMADLVKQQLKTQELEQTLRDQLESLDDNQLLVITTKSGTRYALWPNSPHGRVLGRWAVDAEAPVWTALSDVWSVDLGGGFRCAAWHTTRIVSWNISEVKHRTKHEVVGATQN